MRGSGRSAWYAQQAARRHRDHERHPHQGVAGVGGEQPAELRAPGHEHFDQPGRFGQVALLPGLLVERTQRDQRPAELAHLEAPGAPERGLGQQAQDILPHAERPRQRLRLAGMVVVVEQPLDPLVGRRKPAGDVMGAVGDVPAQPQRVVRGVAEVDVQPVPRRRVRRAPEAALAGARPVQVHRVGEVVLVIRPDPVVAAPPLRGIAGVGGVAEVEHPQADHPLVGAAGEEPLDRLRAPRRQEVRPDAGRRVGRRRHVGSSGNWNCRLRVLSSSSDVVGPVKMDLEPVGLRHPGRIVAPSPASGTSAARRRSGAASSPTGKFWNAWWIVSATPPDGPVWLAQKSPKKSSGACSCPKSASGPRTAATGAVPDVIAVR